MTTDKERLDWLERTGITIVADWRYSDGGWFANSSDVGFAAQKTYRQAIDAAMRAEKKARRKRWAARQSR